MFVEFDQDKDEANRRKHGLSLGEAAHLDLDHATVVPDEAYGVLNGRLHVLAFTMRGVTLRAISFRKANRREVRRYGRQP